MADWKTWTMTKLQAAVGFYFVSKSTAKGYGPDDAVQTHPAAPPGRTSTLRVRRMWPFGVRSVVPEGVEAITVGPMGSETQKVMIAAESKSFGPSDLGVGAVAIYSSAYTQGAVCIIKIDENGEISIQAKSGQKVKIDAGTGADVQVNGGDLRVGRLTDPVNNTAAFRTWAEAVRAQIVAAGGGNVGDPPAQIGTIADGAQHFKA